MALSVNDSRYGIPCHMPPMCIPNLYATDINGPASNVPVVSMTDSVVNMVPSLSDSTKQLSRERAKLENPLPMVYAIIPKYN